MEYSKIDKLPCIVCLEDQPRPRSSDTNVLIAHGICERCKAILRAVVIETELRLKDTEQNIRKVQTD